MGENAYISNNGDSGRDAFQTFCQTCRGDLESLLEDGVVPRRSIFISPSTSIGIGCERVEAGTTIGLLMSEDAKLDICRRRNICVHANQNHLSAGLDTEACRADCLFDSGS